jgi:hypothetical protein
MVYDPFGGYNPFTWYWLADDARVYAGNRQIITNDADAAYSTWLSDGNIPSSWPRDLAGNQTNAALQDVLMPYNMFVDLKAYTADARWRRRNAGIKVTSLSSALFLSDEPSVNDINSSYNYGQANPAATFHWKMADGSFTTLNATQITTLHNDILNYVQSCYACESTTIASINGGTITTRAQVDSVFAAVTNVFP